ncbi:glycosyltransferase family A protein [Devosia faecipullorum]|uniref:glycosyltransferase family A protein n=1 Tax=Devosia faecipullorum TaxID=2755039 RepID=UPI00187B9C41|nr:glycosyltransferase family A protein [Devosia faecipullorum]MBE7731977.1 glycosyltransferase family 2 protein [Devosia faecipullorum]
MPTYMRTTYLREALDSALAQTYPNIEILVSDDSDNDDIGAIVRSYAAPNLHYRRNVPALGFVPKLDDFLDVARGGWMVILCDDDVLEPDFVARLIANSRNHPDASLLRSRNTWIDIEGKVIQTDPASPHVSTPGRFLLDLYLPQAETFRVNLSGFMFQPHALKALGGFTPLYAARHLDRLAWADLAILGPVICDEQALCRIRLHGSSVSSVLERDYEAAIEATQIARRKIMGILDRAEAKAGSEQERQEIAQARQMAVRYCQEHMSRALRQGLVTKVMNSGGDPEELVKLREQWAKHGLPLTSLTRLVLAITRLPLFLRKPLVSAMLRVRSAQLH